MTTTQIASKRGRPVETDKLEQVLAVATEEFARRGYRAVTMREVAEVANVSTRTLYNHYADKLSLFTACIDAGAASFPTIDVPEGEDIRDRLKSFAAAVVKQLSTEPHLHMGLLIYREGQDFPEIRRAAKQNQETFLVQPMARLLRAAGLERRNGFQRANLFINMATSEWQRRIVFGEPAMSAQEISSHAGLVTDIFLDGVRALAVR